jgi:hypothetical protein
MGIHSSSPLWDAALHTNNNALKIKARSVDERQHMTWRLLAQLDELCRTSQWLLAQLLAIGEKAAAGS